MAIIKFLNTGLFFVKAKYKKTKTFHLENIFLVEKSLSNIIKYKTLLIVNMLPRNFAYNY